jgi:phage baseplate assembly protein gpV
MIEETLAQSGQKADTNRFYGVVTGKVISMLDPLTLGRLQVQLPFIDALDLSPWARVALPMAGVLHGTYFIPNLGDEVLVAFEHGDTNVPYIIGCLWSAAAPPPMPSPLTQIRAIRTPVGNQIVFTEAPPSLTLQTGPTPPVTLPAPPVGATISMLSQSVQIQCGLNVINITPGGVTITGTPVLNLVASQTISIGAPTVSISGGTVSIVGGMVRINSP